jgi:hypothetical protein
LARGGPPSIAGAVGAVSSAASAPCCRFQPNARAYFKGNAEADFEAVHRLQGRDKALLIFGAFNRPFMEPENVARILIAGPPPHGVDQQLRQPASTAFA